jgi:hypothetical protein
LSLIPTHQRAPSLSMIVATCLGALAIVWLVVAVWIGQLRELGREAASREMSSLATLLVDPTERTFQGVDLLLALFTSRLGSVLATDAPPNPAELHEILHRDMAGLPQVRRAFAFGTDGKVIADSQFPEPRMIDASDRPHFTVHRDDPNIDVFVSEPIQSRVDGDWSIVLSRRLNRPDGSFAGVVGATLRPEYFTEIFAASIHSPDTKVVLWRNGGGVLATATPEQPPVVGSRQSFSSDHMPARRGLVVGKSPLFDMERISAYARLDRYPRDGRRHSHRRRDRRILGTQRAHDHRRRHAGEPAGGGDRGTSRQADPLARNPFPRRHRSHVRRLRPLGCR